MVVFAMPTVESGPRPALTPPPRRALLALAAFALVGVVFAAVSSYDFIAHLDRQVHSITCSIIPGVGPKDASGSSGCHAVLMSPYSSVLRDLTWGGIPIALPALGVFAFLLFRAIDLLFHQRLVCRETQFMIAATALPVLTSIVYAVISLVEVDTLCKTCVGIYVSSLGVFAAAIAVHVSTGTLRSEPPGKTSAVGLWGFYFVEGAALVALPVLLYLVLKPAYADSLLRTSGLRHPDDKYGVMIETRGGGRVPAVEVLDPLCPACKGFAQRLAASSAADQLRIKYVLFPLDKECNWMVNESLHPGACAVSEAVLCAGDRAPAVLSWALGNHEALRALGSGSSAAVYQRIRKEFPELGDCVGRPAVRARVNKSLRWIVANSLPVLTPQLFVGNQRIPDEDTDLGLDYVLARVLAAGAAGGKP